MTSTVHIIRSYRIRRTDLARQMAGCPMEVSPGYATQEAARIQAKCWVEIRCRMGVPAFAQVIPSLSKPQINL